MSALINSTNGEATNRCIMVVLDDKNYDIFRKVMMIYFNHFLANGLYVTDTTGVCKKTCVRDLNVSVATWQRVFKIINLAGYYIVHDIHFEYLWIIGTYEDIVVDKKYVNYIQNLNNILGGAKQ